MLTVKVTFEIVGLARLPCRSGCSSAVWSDRGVFKSLLLRGRYRSSPLLELGQAIPLPISAILNASFYLLQQLVHSLPRFLSIFRKLVCTHHCGKYLKPHAILQVAPFIHISASCVPGRCSRPRFPLAAETTASTSPAQAICSVGGANVYLQEVYAQCHSAFVSST